jgi:uncharacterized protein (DUF934 family)
MLLDGNGELEDLWTPVADHEPLPEMGYALVAFPRLAEALEHGGLYLGVEIPNHCDAAKLAPHFDRLGLIAVDFPSLADGRGFSIAAKLREIGFRGRLRASGPVIADQFAYLLACGFDEVLVPDTVALRQPPEQWARQLSAVTLAYQRGRPVRASILDQRRSATGAPPGDN